MKPTINYIVIALCVIAVIGMGGYTAFIKQNAAKQAVDTYQIQQLEKQQATSKKSSDSLNAVLRRQNHTLVEQNIKLVAERDSLAAISDRHINSIIYDYQKKLAGLSRLPDDSLHSIFAKQLSTYGGH